MTRSLEGEELGAEDGRPGVARSAVVWVNGRHAVLATVDGEHPATTQSVERALDSELAFVGRVCEAIGDCERVVILGPSTARLALEREYVTLYQRPDRLVDVEPAGPVDESDLVARVRQLAGVRG